MVKKYKLIILGPQCSGKTTLRKYLTKNFDLNVKEEDEMLVDLNHGVYPKNKEIKSELLHTKLYKYVTDSDSIIFLASYYDEDELINLKQKGFKVLQLVLNREEFEKRNERRMAEGDHDDARVWAEQIFDYHKRINETGFIDLAVDAKLETKQVAEQVVRYLKQNFK